MRIDLDIDSLAGMEFLARLINYASASTPMDGGLGRARLFAERLQAEHPEHGVERAALNTLLDEQAKLYNATVRGLAEPGTGGTKPGFSKKRREDLCAGFNDGQGTIVTALVRAGYLTIRER